MVNWVSFKTFSDKEMMKIDRRRCNICGATLSIYNRRDSCFHHKEDTPEEKRRYVSAGR